MHYPKVLERVDSPEQIFHRSFSLGAPDNLHILGDLRAVSRGGKIKQPFLKAIVAFVPAPGSPRMQFARP